MVRPLVYYAVAIFVGSLTCLILINNPFVGVFIAISFLYIMYFTINRKFFYLLVCFFIIGVINYYCYFNINLPKSQKVKVRISQKSTYYCTAKCDNKIIVLEGDIADLKRGEVFG